MNSSLNMNRMTELFRRGRVYPITSSENRHGWGHVQIAQSLLDAGARIIQVRDKSSTDQTLYEQLRQIRKICRDRKASLIVNDRIDLAQAVGADGVHLGQDDLPVAIARKILGSHALIGISTHNRKQFDRALRWEIDYVAVGPVFPSPTKESLYPPLGPGFIRSVADSRLPIVAIGGITLDRAPEVWQAGAAAVAVISDIVDAPDPGARFERYRQVAREVFA